MSERLKLRACDADDLAVLSATLQDALVPLADMARVKDDGSFVLAVNRYRWEDDTQATRVHALLRIRNADRIQTRGIDRRERHRVLDLLQLTFVEGALIAEFAGGGAIRVVISALDCTLEDVSDPWPAQATPSHDEAQ